MLQIQWNGIVHTGSIFTGELSYDVVPFARQLSFGSTEKLAKARSARTWKRISLGSFECCENTTSAPYDGIIENGMENIKRFSQIMCLDKIITFTCVICIRDFKYLLDVIYILFGITGSYVNKSTFYIMSLAIASHEDCYSENLYI